MNPEFCAWPKVPRLNRDMLITEKLDGTNAAVLITTEPVDPGHPPLAEGFLDIGAGYATNARVYAQSRKRFVTPEDDNYGFAEFVKQNADALINGLGEGRHFGEWWGLGIQRGYDMREKRFSLFNVHRWADADLIDLGLADIGVDVVPTLVVHKRFCTVVAERVLDELRENGSMAAPGFMEPEGIVVQHVASRQLFKVTLENDEVPKTLAVAA